MRLCAIVLLFALGASAQAPNLTTDQLIQLYQGWVAKDPANISNRTLLAGAYVQKTRETTDFDYLNRASKVLDSVLAEKQDYEALRLRNIVELTLHHFSQAADYARAMTVRRPNDVQSWGTLGDALLEMGRYDEARDAFTRMLKLKPGLMSYNRMGFYYFVTGDPERGIALMKSAVDAAAMYPENKAWCLVELGNIYFKTGRWSEAEQSYREAVAVFPSAHAAFAALGSVHAAQGKLAEAIENFKRAQAITPMVQYAGALYDLYTLTGKQDEARRQSDLVDVFARIEAAGGLKANRTLALIYANQDRNLDQALELAQADFTVRQDAYTSDVLAWALFKNRRTDEAWHTIQAALKLGAPEALFFYHAGMIARAMNKISDAKEYFGKALVLNAGFDVRQAAIARRALEEIHGESE